MIKSTQKGIYGDARTGIKTSLIETKIVYFESYPDRRIYYLENYLVNDEGANQLYGDRFSKTITNEELSALDAYLENSGIPFTKEVDGVTQELYGNEREFAKLPFGLLYFIQNDFIKDENGVSTDKTVFGLNPNDWTII